MQNQIGDEDRVDKERIEEKQKPDFAKGIETEEYDILPEALSEENNENRFQEKNGIVLEYSFNGSEVKEGLKIYQKETLYKKNLIFSIIFLIMFCIFSYNLIQHPGEGFSMFLAIMCIAMIGFLWYYPLKHIKKTAEAADLSEMKFSMEIFEEGISIKEENGQFAISYNKEITKIIETPRLLLICVGKERMFILPKRYLIDGNEEKVINIFKDAMKNKFIQKTE